MAHIGIDARLTHYRLGGISRYITAIISAFEELEPAHEITVLQSRKSPNRLSSRFRRAGLWTPPHHRLERAALSLELWPRGLDLLHSPDFIAPYRAARRHIITVHDLSFIHYPKYITAESRRYYNGQIKASIARADHILVDSEATKRDLIDILSAPADLITVHMLGVDEAFQPLPRETTADVIGALGLPAEYFLFVGTLEPRKNLVGLANAYRELKLEIPDAPKLVVVGRPGWHYEQLMAELRMVGIDQHLEIRHDVTDAQLPALYNQALAMVTPSFYEGFGLTALEAMACGTAPIVSCVASLPEIVGDVGLLIDPHDTATITQALKTALTDDRWREAQSQAALRRAAGFRWIDTGRCVLECYDAALS
ncbi:MAG: glycosyltransferase family 1 protein [Chloroflexi bacterium]|nr:glycosyltransferase family 1 protein [Chloroflexota bacterium]